MKTRNHLIYTAICLTGIIASSCNGLSKMMKDASKISYTVKPNPLQDNGDSVAVSISAQFPAKYFNKKAIVTVTPTLKFADGTTQALKPITLVGDKATQSGIKISYDQGGSVNYNDKVAYTQQMRTDELDVNAILENNKKALPPVKVADGTIVTSLLVEKDARPILGKDNFTKTTMEKDTTHIFYLISNSSVRSSEINSKEMKEFKKFIENGVKEGYKFDNIDLSAFASPDGETAFNSHLAEDREKSAEVAMKGLFKGMNSKKLNTKFGQESSFYSNGQTGMDWEGFESMVKKSDIKDKDLILRVLSMYTDHDQRMKEIKNLSATYTVLADNILPKLRRSVIVLNAEKKSRTDEEIKQLVSSHPEELSVEEILYSATLTNDINQKLSIYKTAEKQYPSDWRGFNNAAYQEIMQNETESAKADLNKASQLSPSNPIIANNMGVIALLNNDTKTASADFKKAGSAGPQVAYNMGLIDIKQGNYADAAGNMSGINSFNSALAKVLNNDASGAQSTLDASADRSANAYYLKAVIAARNGNKSEVMSNLQVAISQDGSLKKMAATDCEFIKFRTDSDFKSLVGAAL
jgi:hypothetical protein